MNHFRLPIFFPNTDHVTTLRRVLIFQSLAYSCSQALFFDEHNKGSNLLGFVSHMIGIGEKMIREMGPLIEGVMNMPDLRMYLSKAVFTWREGNLPRRVTLLGGLPSSIVFHSFVYMRGRVTPGGG